jgi:hypothetical protein
VVRLPWRRPSRWGAVVLGVWLIATGVLQLVPRLNFDSAGTLLAVVAIAAGALLVLER